MTIGTPMRNATSEISHCASFSKPSPSTTIEGSPSPPGAAARRIAAKRSSAAWWSAGSRSGTAGPSSSPTSSQASGAKPIPVGMRRLSSSTRNSPAPSRITSSPAKPAHTGWSRPCMSGS